METEMPGIWKILAYIIAAYAALSIYVYFMQSSLIFYPNMPGRNLVATPENIGLTYQNVEFVTEDNIKLHGWFIPNKNEKERFFFFTAMLATYLTDWIQSKYFIAWN